MIEEIFQRELLPLKAECLTAHGFLPNTQEQGIADAALEAAMRSWPTGDPASHETRREMRRRQAEQSKQADRISRQIAPQFIDPITGFVLYQLVSFVVGRVLGWLWEKWFRVPSFAAVVQACASAAPVGA